MWYEVLVGCDVRMLDYLPSCLLINEYSIYNSFDIFFLIYARAHLFSADVWYIR